MIPKTGLWKAIRPLLFCVLILSLEARGDGSWGYGDDEHGPAHWTHISETCGGKEQSPIDLTKPFLKDMGEIGFRNYSAKLKKPTLSNNFHTAQMTAINVTAGITGGCMASQSYRFLQLHFHWGSDQTKGSEHRLNGKAFPMEGHFVHMNTDYGSVGEALLQKNGLAVLGVFFEMGEKDNPDFKPIIDVLKEIQLSNTTAPLKESLSLDQLLPEITNQYLCYQGSLTTPTCNEVVTWTVLKNPIKISENQMNEFRKLHSGKSDSDPLLLNNFRPIQNLGVRKIYYYNSAETVGISTTAMLSALLCYFSYLSVFTKAT